MGLTMAFYFAFGADLYDFRSLTYTAYTLVRVLNQDFDWYTMYRSNRLLAPFLFITYVLFAMFILFNIFLGIVNESFAKVKEEDASKPPLTLLILLKEVLEKLRKLGHVMLGHILGRSVTENFDSADKDQDGVVDEQELEEILEKNKEQMAELGIDLNAQEMMMAFDKDNDGVLDEEELEELKQRMENSASAEKAMADQPSDDAELSSEDSDDDLQEIIRKAKRKEKDANRAALLDTGGMHERLEEDWGKIGGIPGWIEASHAGGWAHKGCGQGEVPELDDTVFTDSAVKPEDMQDLLALTYAMMEKMNQLTKYVMQKNDDKMHDKQMSEVERRLDRTSVLLRNSAFLGAEL
jgi:hypothetical protein